MESLNAMQYKELMDELGIISLPEGLTDQTNWFDETYTTGNTQNYQISLSNGTDKLKYFLSAGYQNEKVLLKQHITNDTISVQTLKVIFVNG